MDKLYQDQVIAFIPQRNGKYESVDARYDTGRVIEHCRMERLLTEIAASRSMALPLLRRKGKQGDTLFMGADLALMSVKMKEGESGLGYINLAEVSHVEVIADGAGIRMKNGDFFSSLWRAEKLAEKFQKEMVRYGEKYGK